MMRLTCKLVPICLLLALAWLLLPAVMLAQEPDFSDETDILNGQTHLLRSDDIGFTYAQNATAAPYTNELWTNLLLMNESIISQQYISWTTTVTTVPVSTEVRMAMGRMFDLPNDVSAIVAVEGPASQDPGQPQLVATIYDQIGNRTLRQVLNLPADTALVPAGAVMADFTGDGYDDLAVSFAGAGSGLLAIMQATDPGSWAAGVVVGPAYDSSAAYSSLVAADVDGNGVRELVAVTNGADASGAGGEMVVFGVDPVTLALTAQATTALGATGLENKIASGDYDGNPADDEVVVALSGTAAILPALQLYDFPNKPAVGTLLDQVNVRESFVAGVDLASGRVHWFGADGDAIILSTNNVAADSDGAYLLSTYLVKQNKLVLQSPYTDGSTFHVEGMALGRFDNKITAGTFNPDLQLAVLLESDIGGVSQYLIVLLVFGGNGSGYTVTEQDVLEFQFQKAVYPSLATGDLQGRSLRLGAAQKITINGHNAPSTVVGVPPMHLDWVIPSCADPNYPNNCTTPHQVEILAEPSSNYAQLNTQVKASSQSSSQKTTSYSMSTQESVDSKLSYGIPDIFSVSTEVKDTAKQTYDKSVATTNNSYSSVEFDASVRTGFADHVWFDNVRFNLWTYPVLGQNVCPAAIPNCSTNQKFPLHLQFSGPDQINTYDLDGNVVEWYQPVWEPGNVLSYPWTEAQLETLLQRSTVVNKSDVWAADSSGSNASVTWSQGGGQDVTQGSTKTYSNDTSISVSANASIGGFGIDGSASFDASTSNSTQTLNTSSNTHGSSTGFSIAKTLQGVDDYVYAAQTYILGQAPITGTLQTLPLTATVQTSGPLRLAYWANPYDSVVGGTWWVTAYDLPDVALNHPQRWTWTSTPVQPNIMTFNHAVTSTSPFDQEFYLMRGLYITSQGAPAGPQIVTAPVTETVLLQARVYNYSHVDMNAASLEQKAAAVKVRFYGQVFQSDTGDYPVGQSFLIGEQSLASIPGFASATTPGDAPNWSMAVQPFDPALFAPTQKGNVYLRFWVVVWMEDSAGVLVSEMAGHGLAANPGQGTITTMGDVQVEPYSNNVGTFKQVFYIPSPNPGLSQAIRAEEPPTLTLSARLVVPAAPLPPAPLGKHLVTTVVRNGGSEQPAVQVLYYDGDPAQGGRLFDWELIPHLAAGAQHVNRVTYTPQICGGRTLYVIVRSGTGEVTNSSQVAGVPCQLIFPYVRID